MTESPEERDKPQADTEIEVPRLDDLDSPDADGAPPDDADGNVSLDLDVTNPAEAAAWLRDSIGKGRLAGLFARSDAVVYIAREGESGYESPPRDCDHDGPAQVRPLTHASLAAYLDARFRCYKWVKVGKEEDVKSALFPLEAAKRVVDLPDPALRPGLRRLAGVVHTPVVRADGSILDTPGYDPETRLYYLPDLDLVVPPVPEKPTTAEVNAAVELLDQMTAGFPWKSVHHRANYYGLLVTPLLRNLTPPPYKLFIFDAPQQGTGKTLLAELARGLHGGILRGGMPHTDDAETRKVVTTVLSRTTGAVVILDNLTGLLDSPVLAGLLTSTTWADRLLGATEEVTAVNDRVWTCTANNLAVGPDMVRRVIWVGIDAQMARPQDRTEFAIADLPGWTRAHRGELLHALLVLIRAWVVAGRPMQSARTSDCFAYWVQVVDSILAHAGMSGRFADPSTEQVTEATEDTEWAQFLAAAHRAFGTKTWTAKDLLRCVRLPNRLAEPDQQHLPVFPLDHLPDQLAEKASNDPRGAVGAARSLGIWLTNRDGRYVGDLCARCATTDGHSKVKLWRIESNKPGTAAGTAGTAGTTSANLSVCAYETNTERNETVEHLARTNGEAPRSPRSPRTPAPQPAGVAGPLWDDTRLWES